MNEAAEHVGLPAATSDRKVTKTNVMASWPLAADRTHFIRSFDFPSQDAALAFSRAALRIAAQKALPVGLDFQGLSVGVRLPTQDGKMDHGGRVLARRLQRHAEAATASLVV